MRVLVIEDERLVAYRIRSMFQRCEPPADVTIFPSVQRALYWLKSHPAPDLIIIDTHLEDNDCLPLFDAIDSDTPVIVTIFFDEHLNSAFGGRRIEYLLKPFSFVDFAAVFQKVSKPETRCRN